MSSDAEQATVIAAVVVLILNMLLPVEHRWLSEAADRQLYQILFSGTIGGVLTHAVRKLRGRPRRRR